MQSFIHTARTALFGQLVRLMLRMAGIRVNGDRPWDIRIRPGTAARFYERVLRDGSGGFMEGYQYREWTADDLVGCFMRLKRMSNALESLVPFRKARKLGRQDKDTAEQNAEFHYDGVPTEFFEQILGRSMKYSCANFNRGAKGLDEAQYAQMEHLAQKLRIEPGMRVLDVGCGWGTLLEYLARRDKIEGVGITRAKNQIPYGRQRCKGLPIEIRDQDYREVDEKFDRIISVGMFEHVGIDHYGEFFKRMHACLRPDGILVLHAIMGHGRGHPWVNKHIFPGGELGSLEQTLQASSGYFHLWDQEEMGLSYAKTLHLWRDNFHALWPRFQGRKVGDREFDEFFYLTEEEYLASSEALFKGGFIWLYQLQFGMGPRPARFVPVR